jgi:hypothetical protein
MPTCRQGRKWQFALYGYCANDLCFTRRLHNLRRRIQKEPKHHLDYEADQQGVRVWHFLSK